MNSFLTNLWNSRTKKLRVVIAITALIICVWIVFFPRPYYLVVGIGILFMPILIFSSLIDRDRFEFQEPKQSDANRVNLLGPFWFVLCALMVRAAADIQITDDLEVLKLIIPIGLTVALINWVILKRANLPLLLMISLAYSLPLVMELNDWGPSTNEFVIIGPIERTYTSTRPLSQTIVIRFNHEDKHVHVSREVYRRSRVGDTACAKEQKGWLGLVKLFPIRCP
jgi:amino acid transporter